MTKNELIEYIEKQKKLFELYEQKDKKYTEENNYE